MPEGDISSVIPAQLSFLAIYNPRLGTTDETVHDQVVFYTSKSGLLRRQESSAAADKEKEVNDDRNERLRQVGLAQGMVSFARNFSEGKAVDYVETEKSQIFLHELEKDWWILASVDLTRLPNDPSNGSSSHKDSSGAPFNFSSREVSPPQLLIQQLLRAHSIFLIHHAPSLDTLYKNIGRSTFCLFLENFWLKFAWNWDVLFRGNPAVEMYNGVKLSAGGELGIGVGEEEWGSGEREVLEDFVSRTDGLVDLIVSRFGDPYDFAENSQTASKPEGADDQWLGFDAYPRPSDGVVFSGLGAITRQSLVSITQWMEWIYRYGADAYGVGENPTSSRRRKRRKRQRSAGKSTSNQSAPHDSSQGAAPERPFSPGIPRPLVRGTPPPQPSPVDPGGKVKSQTSDDSSPTSSEKASDWIGAGTETFVKYLTLGYGSSWGLPSGSSNPRPRAESSKRDARSSEAGSLSAQEAPKQDSLMSNDKPRLHNRGRFIIGLQDNTAVPDTTLEEIESTDPAADSNEKIVKRTLHVYLTDPQNAGDPVQLQVIIYVHQPFIYAFLFDTTTSSLADPSLYHRIHYQLGPLQKPLSASTSPATAAIRISATPEFSFKSQQQQQQQQQKQPIYDLVYDPHNLTIRSSIPNIPDIISSRRLTDLPSLPRVEAISIHYRLVATYIETRSRPLELERTCKTSRGWWIVWVQVSSAPTQHQHEKLQNPNSASDTDTDRKQEAFIIRQASDHASSLHGHAQNTSSVGGGGGGGTRFFRDLGGASSSPGLSFQGSRMDMGPGKLVDGLGLDARRYIENLLSLNR